MSCRFIAVLTFALTVGLVPTWAAPAVTDAAREMVGGWELSNAERDKRCPVTFSLDPAYGAFKLALDPTCARVFPQLKDVAAWGFGRNDAYFPTEHF